MNALATLSNRELNIWATVLLDVLVAVFYFSSVLTLPSGADFHGKAMAVIIAKIILFSIIYGVSVFGFINWRGEEKKDERDHRFEARANSVAYYVLACGIALLIGQVVMTALLGDHAALVIVSWSPMVIANVLLFTLILASCAKALTQLFYYRRGY